MKATRIVRRIDDLGRVVIPKEIRITNGIKDGDPMEIFVDREGGIIFRKYQPGCAICGEVNDFKCTIHGKDICVDCARIIAGKAV